MALVVGELSSPLTLGIGWRRGAALDAGRIELTKGVADEFRNICERHVAALRQRTAKPYSPEVDLEPREEYLTIPRSSLHTEEPLLMLLDSIADRDPLRASDLPARSLLFHAYVFPGHATFLRKANSHQTARSGRVLTRLSQTLSRVDEPVFAFDDKVDLVVTADEVIVSSLSAFELLFKEDDFLVQHIPTWVNSIATHLPVNDGAAEVLTEHCRRNTRFRRRLETIHARGHLTHVTIEQVCEEAQNQGLDVASLVVDGRLNFEDASVDDLLRLLNEDLLIGSLSGDRFTVERKSPR